jgi:hypothetical integral membrane protein (TIGR02206 family)
MQELFAVDYTGAPFYLFGTAHLIVLGIVLLINVSWVYFRVEPHRSIRYGMATILLVNEFGYHLWRWMTGTWVIQRMLPLHLCSVMVWASIVMLLTKKYRIYEFVYFLGIGGAAQALLTPEAGIYGFPHYRWFQTFIVHGLLVTAPIYMTLVERYRPYWKSLLRVVIATNIYMLFVGIINTLIGSNYMYLARKPDMPTLLDVLGPWPWYLLAMEGLGLLLCLLLYLPFAFQDWRKTVQ